MSVVPTKSVQTDINVFQMKSEPNASGISTNTDNGKLLVVDDDMVDRQQIHRLMGEKFQIIEASTGDEGQTFCENTTPACILLDNELPGRNGIELVEHFAAKNIPVIMITGTGNEELAVKAIQAGAQNYLVKGDMSKGDLFQTIVVAIHTVRQKLMREEWLREKDELIEKLSLALAENKTLTGLIPICSVCKSIRNDTGYWQRVEEYLASRSDAKFSHGLCPTCLDTEKDALETLKRKKK